MRLLIAAVLMTPMLPAAAAAQDWVRVGANDQMLAFVDAASVTRSGSKVTALTFSGYAQALGDTEVWYTQVKVEYNCPANTFRTLEYTYYGRNRKSMGTEASFSINENRTPNANSIDAAFMRFACTGAGGSPAGNIFKDTETRFGR